MPTTAQSKGGTRTRRKVSTPIDPTYAHLQPQALDVERVVLGALMIDKDAFSLVAEKLHPETFYEPRHQRYSKPYRV